MKNYNSQNPNGSRWLWLILVAFGLLIPRQSLAQVGSWKLLANYPSEGIGRMLLLSDGTVMAQGGGGFGTDWFQLTPDTNGSYITGQWTPMTPMHDTRLYYSSDVLQDGRVFVAGGEVGTGYDKAEVYDPIATNWTQIATSNLVTTATNQSGLDHFQGFADSLSVVLSTGKVLITPFAPVPSGETVLFDPVSNTLEEGGLLPFNDPNTDEQSAVKLPDDSILTFDENQNGERYIPAQGQWIPDQSLPVQLFSGGSEEVGAGYLLPDGRAFFQGGTGLTIYYTPTGNTYNGNWTPGPNIPDGLVARDTPSAMMANGKILCEFSDPASNDHTNYFYEFDYSAGPNGTFTQTSGPNSPLTNTNRVYSDKTSMLDLPDGTVLFSDTYGQLYDYQPGTAPLASGKPVINSIAYNTDGSLHISGTQLNGISQGASYGDDAQMDSNYPLVRFTDGHGNVTYGRTYNWSSTGVQTGSKIVTTECKLPASISNIFNGSGTLSMQVVANGNASDPVTLYGPVWVDFNYSQSFPQMGTVSAPFSTLAQGTNAVVSGGTIAIKAGHSPIAMKIAKPMTIIAVGGKATVGQ